MPSCASSLSRPLDRYSVGPHSNHFHKTLSSEIGSEHASGEGPSTTRPLRFRKEIVCPEPPLRYHAPGRPRAGSFLAGRQVTRRRVSPPGRALPRPRPPLGGRTHPTYGGDPAPGRPGERAGSRGPRPRASQGDRVNRPRPVLRCAPPLRVTRPWLPLLSLVSAAGAAGRYEGTQEGAPTRRCRTEPPMPSYSQ